ncbi:MAG: hypothetical protein K5765_03240 [Clostridia bacterium]|nr:hypothetical protein [Clostridia bacterium]
MQLTLYQNSILNNSYSNVFYCKEFTNESNETYIPFARYLYSLTQETYEIENVYMTNKGEINLPLDAVYSNLWKYNYLKFSNGSTNFYAFIDRYEEKNEVAIIYYSLDYWHTFSDLMSFKKSYLTRSRFIDYDGFSLSPYHLPLDYDGNNPLLYAPLITNSTGKYALFVRLQVYTARSAGEFTERYSLFGILNYDENYQFDLNEITNITQELIVTTGTNKWKSNLTGITLDGAYVQLANFYILPLSFSTIINTFNTNTSVNYVDMLSANTTKYTIKGLNDSYLGVPISQSITIPSNFRIAKIGTFNNPIDAINNGTSIGLNISMISTMFDTKIMFNCQNQIVDITTDFEMELPFTSVNGEVNTLNKMNRILGNISLGTSIFGSVAGISNLINEGNIARTGSTKSVKHQKINYARKNDKFGELTYRRQTSTKTWYDTTKTYGLNEIGLNNIESDVSSIIKANMPYYSSNSGTFGDTSGLVNAILGGLFIFYINDDNQLFVQNLIDETGYEVFYFGKDEIIDDVTNLTNWNVIKFDSANIYGSFSQEVMQILKNILEDGIKIYYRNPTD